MYKAFFGLNRHPFRLTPDIGCFFAEGKRKAILDGLLYAVNKGDGIVKVVGEVGSGKTLLSRMLAASLSPSFEVLCLVNPRIPPDSILLAIALELGLSHDGHANKVSLQHAINQRLLELHRHGKRTVLIIDEAQAMPLASLEEIRMLSNLETAEHKLLQMVLFGQPELDQHLASHAVRQIQERIVHGFYLPRLRRAEVGRYLAYRLQHAGLQDCFPFTEAAVSLLSWRSFGLLRRLNILAEKCLLSAFAQQKRRIGVFMVLRVAFENRIGRWRNVAVAGVLTLLLASGLGLMIGVEWPVAAARETPIPDNPTPMLSSAQEAMAADRLDSALVFPDAVTDSGYSIQLLQTTAGFQYWKQLTAGGLPETLRPYVFAAAMTEGYRMFLGVFSSYESATAFLQQLPEPLKKFQPYVINHAEIVKKYRQRLLFRLPQELSGSEVNSTPLKSSS